MNDCTFEQLNLIDPLLRAIREEGYERPTPIQAEAIPHLLLGRDQLGCAETGTGKTAAFALPILQRLSESKSRGARRRPRVLVLAPTRELAAQINESFVTYGRFTGLVSTAVFGGVGQGAQAKALRGGVDILVATPGRLLDLLNQGHTGLDRVEILVLDEADRMLDMGFIHDVRRILKLVPEKRQTLLFSATMPPEISSLASKILVRPVVVEVVAKKRTAEKIDQRMHFVSRADKRRLLVHLLADPGIERAIVFTRTKHGADRVVKQLGQAGILGAAIHGNKSQGQRERALGGFKTGKTRLLVATDIAARGIDVDGITHVVNYDLPNIPETYVHRIGRTARAGASGVALSFCDNEERAHLIGIERLIGKRIPRVSNHPYAPLGSPPETTDRPSAPAPRARSRPARSGRGRRAGAAASRQ